MSEANTSKQDDFRARVRAAGLSGDYWYPMAQSAKVPRRGKVKAMFWKQPIAIFRDENGAVHAVENRCAHRHLELTLGEVKGCNLVCEYHGWEFDGGGECVHIPHEVKGNRRPEIRIKSYPVQEKYGLIWVFPGDPEKAARTPLPTVPQLEGPHPWKVIPLEFTWKAHHSMITENVCDFYHEHLHRKYKPFTNAKIQKIEEQGESVMIEYQTVMSEGQAAKAAAHTDTLGKVSMKVWYDYPYQRSNTNDTYLHWLFQTPIDEGTTQCFFLFVLGGLRIPGTNLEIPMWMRGPVLRLANKLYVLPLLAQDALAMEAEQRAHEPNKHRPVFEFNPVVRKMQALTLRKWDEWNASEAARAAQEPQRKGARPSLPVVGS